MNRPAYAMPLLLLTLLLPFAPSAAAELAQAEADSCRPILEDDAILIEGVVCVLTATSVGADTSIIHNGEEDALPGQGITTTATVVIQFTRTNTACTVRWDTHVSGSSSVSRYNYLLGLTAPSTFQMGGFNVAGPVTRNLGGNLVVARGVTVTAGASISNTVIGPDSASSGVSFRC